MMIEAILFDLDGTLLDVDMDDFLDRYIDKLAIHLSDFTDQQSFKKNLWSATGAMVRNTDPAMTNEEAFLEHFYTWVNHPHEKVWPYVDDFYNTVFPTLKEKAVPYPQVDTVINNLRNRYRLALATNPIFPLSAIKHRLSWSGIESEAFEIITAYENMHFTKPDPKYYIEISQMLGLAPHKCVMVGNDPVFDIKPAREAGMHTYLTNESLPGLSLSEATGRIADLPVYLLSLPDNRE